MKGASQLLVDTGLLDGARSPLLIGPPPEDASTLAETGAELFFFEEASHARAGVGHAGVAPRTGDHDLAVVFHPKGKRRRDYALAVASHALAEGGRLAIVGEKREGIGSAKKALKVTAKHSGSHAKLFVGEPRTDLPAQLSEWESRWDTGLGFEAGHLRRRAPRRRERAPPGDRHPPGDRCVARPRVRLGRAGARRQDARARARGHARRQRSPRRGRDEARCGARRARGARGRE